MDTILISVHILGAFLLAIVWMFSILKIIVKNVVHHHLLAKIIGYASALQIVSGSALALVNHRETGLTLFCAKMGLYVLITVAIEAMLYIQLPQNNISKFPIRILSLSGISSIFIALSTATLIFFT
jgi:hypothetical protein